MDYLTLGKIILATPWLICLSIRDFRKHELPNTWVIGGSSASPARAFAIFSRATFGTIDTAMSFLSFLHHGRCYFDAKFQGRRKIDPQPIRLIFPISLLRGYDIILRVYRPLLLSGYLQAFQLILYLRAA